jgi:sigma-B regulation protein RsbU (phosphoserine phosphatase)
MSTSGITSRPEQLSPPAASGSAELLLDTLQQELNRVRDELETLRHRDSTLRYYMHRIDEELRLAARLQQDFLPKKLPEVGQLRFHTLFRPAGHVSGDLYDVMRVDESHVAFYMADAVGHGMPAALLSMFLKTALVTKEISPDGYRLLAPALTMQKLNDALVEQNLSQATFATSIYGTINTRTLRLTFARGGHPNPILLKPNREVRELLAEGSLLGIFPGEQFDQTVVQLEPGDRVFIYSDGLELAFNDEPTLDNDRWRQELIARGHLPTEQILREFAEHIDRDPGNRLARKDDLTVIVAEIDPI